MKKIRALSIFSDIMSIYAGFLLGLLIRFSQGSLLVMEFQDSVIFLFFLSMIYIGALLAAGAYQRRFKTYSQLAQKTFNGLLFGVLLSMSFTYLFREQWGHFPRSVFLISFPLIFMLSWLSKSVIYKLTGHIFKKTVFIRDIELKNIDTLWQRDDVLDEVVIMTNLLSAEQLYKLIRNAEIKNAKLSLAPKIYDEFVASKINGKIKIKDAHLSALPMYLQDNSSAWLIRMSDIAISVALSLLFLPIMAIVALLIKIDSPGPAIYTQKRIGLKKETGG